jgi:hypothetical protein
MTRDPNESFHQRRPRWISPLKLREYYADFLLPPEVGDTQRALYKAVITRAIRAKLNGRPLTKEEAAALGQTRWGDAENPYALPSDLELSVEDAERIWPASKARGSAFYKDKGG